MWFTESAWPPMIVLFVLAIISVAAWGRTKRGLFLVLAIVLLAICPAIYVAEQRIVTDNEKVEAAVVGMTRAFQQKDLDGTLSYVSANAVDVRALATAAMQIVTVKDDMRVTDVRIRLVAQNSRAISRFRVNATISLPQYGELGYKPSMWELSWQREQDEWKVVSVMRLDPVSGEELAPLAAAP